MPFWPFNKDTTSEVLSKTELRDRAIELARAGNAKALRKFCGAYKAQINQNLDIMCKLPDGMSTEDSSIDAHFQCVIGVAQCLANECGSPEMMNRLVGNADDNPLEQLSKWFTEMPARVENLEYESLISEGHQWLEQMADFRGSNARLQEVFLHGRLGELQFHSGKPQEALKHFTTAYNACVESNDVEGQLAYLSSLFQVHLYLDDGKAIGRLEDHIALLKSQEMPTKEVERQLELHKGGLPRCRIVCVRDGKNLELDELSDTPDGSYQFIFARNRMSLEKANALTKRGNQFASDGQYAEAMEWYHKASEVDPYNPDPVYQTGMCLLEIGAFAKGREAFEEVERLAPGWFRCRSDRWFAEGLENGTISSDQLMVMRVLDDGGLEPSEALRMAEAAIDKFPDFAPFYLMLAKYTEDNERTVVALRRGLELVEEPDYESRFLCQLAGLLPPESEERRQLIERAVGLKGSLVAHASAKLMGLQ